MKEKAFSCAVNMLKVYILRGETIKQTKSGCMGSCNDRYCASVSGYVGNKKYSSDYVIVTEVDKQKVEYVFKLTDIYDHVLKPQLQLL